MTFQSGNDDMSPKDRAQYGAALVKGAAFDAVYNLWRRRKSEGWTNASIATNVDVDEGWLSKQFVGPRNWTIVTFGTLVESLKGTAQINVYAAEDLIDEMNANSYSDYEETIERKAASQVPPLRQGGITGSPNDPSVSNILDMILAKKEPTPVPMA